MIFLITDMLLALFIILLVVLAHCSSVLSQGFNGENLIIGGYNSPPYEVLVPGPNGNYTFVGSSFEAMKWVARRLNFTTTMVPILNDALVTKIDTNELALMKIFNNEVDGVATSLIVTPARLQWCEFTTALTWFESYSLISPKPKQESRLFAFIRPFDSMVWFSLAFAAILITVLMACFSWFYQYGATLDSRQNKYFQMLSNGTLTEKLGFYTIYAINILTNHGIYTPFAKHSFRILVGCWLLAALVLVNSYSSIVVSSLTLPKMKPTIETLEDVAASDDVTIILRADVVISKEILQAKSGVFKILGDQARTNPEEHVLNDFPSLFKRLEMERYAFPLIHSFNRFIIVNLYKKSGKCRFHLSAPLNLTAGYFNFPLRKKSKFLRPISKSLMELWETGFPRVWVAADIGKADRCFAKKEKASTNIRAVRIKLEDLSSAFLILGIGVGLGLLSFLVEMIANNVPAQKRNKISPKNRRVIIINN